MADNLGKVLDLLHEAGWEPDGETEHKQFKIITQASYPLAGAVIQLGGRLRFHKPNSDRYVTVGKRTVYFYRKGAIRLQKEYGRLFPRHVPEIIDGKRFKAADTEGIKAELHE